jgi:hypothetical protein
MAGWPARMRRCWPLMSTLMVALSSIGPRGWMPGRLRLLATEFERAHACCTAWLFPYKKTSQDRSSSLDASPSLRPAHSTHSQTNTDPRLRRPRRPV